MGGLLVVACFGILEVKEGGMIQKAEVRGWVKLIGGTLLLGGLCAWGYHRGEALGVVGDLAELCRALLPLCGVCVLGWLWLPFSLLVDARSRRPAK